MNIEICIWLSAEDRAQLESWIADRNTPQKLVWRSRIVLLSAARAGTMSIAREGGGAWGGEGGPRPQGRPHPSRAQAAAGTRSDCASGGQNPAREASGGNPVEHPDDGPDRRPQSDQCAADLDRTRAQAASCARFQAVQ